jgi:hypothetical protein
VRVYSYEVGALDSEVFELLELLQRQQILVLPLELETSGSLYYKLYGVSLEVSRAALL